MNRFLLLSFLTTNVFAEIPLDDLNRAILERIAERRMKQYEGKNGTISSQNHFKKLQLNNHVAIFTKYECGRILMESNLVEFRRLYRFVPSVNFESYKHTWTILGRDLQLLICYSLSETMSDIKRELEKLEPEFSRVSKIIGHYRTILGFVKSSDVIEKSIHDLLLAVDEHDRYKTMIPFINNVLYEFARLPRGTDTSTEGETIWKVENSAFLFRSLFEDVISERSDVEKIKLFIYKLSTKWTKENICFMTDTIMRKFTRREYDAAKNLEYLENHFGGEEI